MDVRNRKKELGYRLFAFIYQVCRLLPVKKNQVFSIMTHDASEQGNIRVLERYMEAQGAETPDRETADASRRMESLGQRGVPRGVKVAYRFCHLTGAERAGVESAGVESGSVAGKTAGGASGGAAGRIAGLFRFFLVKPYQMARAEYILMDNAFLPMAYFRVRKESQVVQLWHGTGTIKKFGQDANTGWLREQEQKINRNITHLIVNAPGLREQYAQAFGVQLERTFATGLPRTDALLAQLNKTDTGQSDGVASDSRQTQSRRKNGVQAAGAPTAFIQTYPALSGKKLLLYAPTFRDSEKNSPKLHLDVKKLLAELPEDYVILLRLHPFVAAAFARENSWTEQEKRICLVSDYPDLTELMLVSDGLITDYSSIVFDYALTDKPMYFLADDLAEFSDNGRGFYEPYESFVPGPVAKREEELAEWLTEDGKDPDNTVSRRWQQRRRRFVEKYYDKLDGQAARRVYERIRK